MPKLSTQKKELEKSCKKTSRFFIFASYHPEISHIPEILLRDLDTAYHLAYYSPVLEEEPFSFYEEQIKGCKEIWKNWTKPPDEVTSIQERQAKNIFFLKEEYGFCESQFHSKWLNLPTCSALFLFLTPEIMTSLPHLMHLMDSQQDEQYPLPVIPFVVEPVDLSSEGDDYKDLLSELEGDLSVHPEEKEYLCDLLRNIQHKLHKNSNYAGFGEDSVTTLTKIQEYLDGETSVFSKELCYRVFRELINFMECNFVNLQFYSEETMSTLYEELLHRIHSSVPQERIPLDGSVQWVENVDVSQFHFLTPEECEMEGDTLLKINCAQPKIALAFPIRAIRTHALAYSNTLEEIILPQGLEEIEENAFFYNTSLCRTYLPHTLTSIGKMAFAYCENLKEMIFPQYMTELSSGILLECFSLKKVVLPETVQTIGVSAFFNCVSLEEINLPEGLEELPDVVFPQSLSLTEITLPSTLKVIGNEVFYHSGLTKIHLPDSLTTVGKDAFSRCYQLEEVTGNTSPENMGDNVFEACVKLKNNPQ